MAARLSSDPGLFRFPRRRSVSCPGRTGLRVRVPIPGRPGKQPGGRGAENVNTLMRRKEKPMENVRFETGDRALQKLYDTACEKARGNLKMFGEEPVLVEGGGYEKIWLETQPMGGEMYAGYDLTAAMNNQRLFMRTQREDGRLAGSIQCLADGQVEAQFNKFQGFCFPWHALNMNDWIGGDRAYLEALYTCLEKFDAYLWRVRDSDGDGILESWCVYDTGEDNALRYGNAPNYCTEETPPLGYDVVPMASMDFMGYSFASRDTLREISERLGNGQAEFWRGKAEQVRGKVRACLWDEEKGACFDRDRQGRVMPVLTHNNLRCMYWGMFTREMADRFVRDHLLNPGEFWTPMPLPSVSVSDPLFRNAPENNWSGQAEGLTYQRAILALERYGYEKIVTRLGRRLMKAVMEGGYVFTQQFDPFTGEPSRVGMKSHAVLDRGSTEPFQDAYGPTVLSVLEYTAHIYGIDMERGRMLFSMGRAGAPYLYERKWLGHCYTLESDGERGEIRLDGKRLMRDVACGSRVITDRAGQVLDIRTIE